jgi:hypothetical protein
MPVLDAVTFELHGARFQSYVAPGRDRAELCAWRTDADPARPTSRTPSRARRHSLFSPGTQS